MGFSDRAFDLSNLQVLCNFESSMLNCYSIRSISAHLMQELDILPRVDCKFHIGVRVYRRRSTLYVTHRLAHTGTE